MRAHNTRVYINYIGSLPDGSVFDDNRAGSPLEVVIGGDRIPKGLEDEIRAMEVGEEATVDLSPEDAYGSYQEEAVFRVPLNSIPNAKNLPVGEYIYWYGDSKKNKSGRPAIARVAGIDDYHVTIDLNHPLAGKTVSYWVKVVGEDLNPVSTDIDRMLEETKKRAEQEKSDMGSTCDA